MRALVQAIHDRLKAFVDQRDDIALVVQSADADALPILKTLQGVEAESASDLFWTFTNAFSDELSYANAVVSTFQATHTAARIAMPRIGMAAWPELPAAVLSDRTPPAQRLRDLAAFSRELLPVRNGGNNVWTFFPLELADPLRFAALMRNVIQHEMPFPWCHHLRFIIRDDPSARALAAALGGAPRVELYRPDLSAEAVYRAVESESADETQPLEQRLSNVLVLAGTDAAFGRYPQAIEKYELLLSYYAPLGNHAMAAVALNGMGDAYEKSGDRERAGAAYQAALIPASHGAHPPVPVLLNVVLNLANLRFTEQRWAESEAYFDSAQQLATVARDGTTKVRALEQRGVCERWQGRLDDAEQSWIAASVIAAQLEDVALCRSSVDRLRLHYAETGRLREERERYEQLLALSAPGPGGAAR